METTTKLTDEQKKIIGEEWVNILMLRKSPDRGDRINPRYQTAWGSKTAIGIYEVITRLKEEEHMYLIKSKPESSF